MRGNAVRIAGDAREDLGAGKHGVDRAEHVGAGSERKLEFAMAKRELRVAMPGGEMARHVGELFRSGALEGENRLFLVADRKDAARLRLAPPLPGRELGDQPA